MSRHKHYDCIVAWASGEKIEFYAPSFNKWMDVENTPKWYEDFEYRIKKEPVIEVKYFRLASGVFEPLVYIEFEPDLEKWDLKITYQDGVAIKAEVAE